MSSQIFNDDILNKINKFMIASNLKKRLIYELSELKIGNAYINIENNETSDGEVLIINIVLDKKTDIFTFHICNNYPFRAPKQVYINYKRYISYLKLESPKTLNEIKQVVLKHKNIMLDCLCCSSLACAAQWSPAIKFKNIINEFYYYKKIRRGIINKLFASKILNKYLHCDDKAFCEYFYSFLIL